MRGSTIQSPGRRKTKNLNSFVSLWRTFQPLHWRSRFTVVHVIVQNQDPAQNWPVDGRQVPSEYCTQHFSNCFHFHLVRFSLLPKPWL